MGGTAVAYSRGATRLDLAIPGCLPWHGHSDLLPPRERTRPDPAPSRVGSQADLPGLSGGRTVPSWALETREPYGVWGGMSVEERQAMQSEQRLA